jgi:hypothetical protein
VQALAEPADSAGTASARKSLDQALALLQSLSDEAKQLHDAKELLSWIGAAQKKLTRVNSTDAATPEKWRYGLDQTRFAMRSNRDKLVKEIFADALEKADAAERAAYFLLRRYGKSSEVERLRNEFLPARVQKQPPPTSSTNKAGTANPVS